MDAVLAALRVFDPDVAPLDLTAARVSHTIAASLWQALPDEHEARAFESEELLTANGASVLPHDTAERITLHLGFHHLAVRTTVEAAWHAWPGFCRVDAVETYNTCMYPDSLRWYIVRAGTHLYPMRCDVGPDPVLADHVADQFPNSTFLPARDPDDGKS